MLGEYHELMGQALRAHGGTLERFTGDGTMVFFNDPFPVQDAAGHALRLALTLRDGFARVCRRWQARGHLLGLGAGVSKGFATAGLVGFDGHWDYAVIGPVTNLAARLCQLAESGQILVCRRVVAELSGRIEVDFLGAVQLKGFVREVEIFGVHSLADSSEDRVVY